MWLFNRGGCGMWHKMPFSLFWSVIIALFALNAFSCSSWERVRSSEEQLLGEELVVVKDVSLAPEADSPDEWHTWVVLRNTGTHPVYAAFRAPNGEVKTHPTVIPPGGKVALRVGPRDAAFYFLGTQAAQPELVARLPEEELKKKYADTPRL